jgi:hypothetical protein
VSGRVYKGTLERREYGRRIMENSEERRAFMFQQADTR